MEKEIELENGLRIKIYPVNQTATVIKSGKVTGNVLIPRYVEDDGKKYPIISLSENAFKEAKFDSLIFPKDSEVETFENSLFYSACLTKLQIPPKLKKIHNRCFSLTQNLIDIEVSPKNKQFSYIENKYLAGKSQEDRDVFDVLLYARYDIEEAVIPPQIEIVNENSFNNHDKLKSVLFPNNSKLKRIEYSAFSSSTLSKLVLPASLEYMHHSALCTIEYLNEIEVSPKNQTFSMINKTLLVKKIDPSSKVFDYLVFCRRDIEHIEIPSYIKVIGDDAFENCKKLNSVNFEPNSTLEKIKNSAFFFLLSA